MEKVTLAAIAADNLQRIRDADPRLQVGQRALGEALRVSEGTVKRFVGREWNPTLETIEQIADSVGIEAWQLLVPGFEPGKPLRAVTEEQFDAEVTERLANALKIKKNLKGGTDSGQERASGRGAAQPFDHRTHDAIRQVDFPDKNPPAEATNPALRDRKAPTTTKK